VAGLGLWALHPRRVALQAGVATPVYPPSGVRGIYIGNATPDDLRVYEDPNDDTTYFIVAAGYEHPPIVMSVCFDPSLIAFYLKATQAGSAVLIWVP